MSGHERAGGGSSRLEEGEPTAPGFVVGHTADVQPVVLRPTTEAFGKYRLLAEMGHGGMADVYLAVSAGPAGFSKLQVIKRLRPNLAEDPEVRAMLLDEARLAAQLNHRNVVQTVEVGAVQDRYFIAMELLDGQPYNRVIRRARGRGAPLPLPFVAKILSDVLAGLHYAHEAKDYSGEPLAVVHRDVSPHNVFVTYDGQVKVVDFGIAKAARRAVETKTGVVRGKVSYMAPEQALPRSCVLDRRADIFSVGVMLWEALAGERMWAGMSDPEILLRLASVGAPPLPLEPSIPIPQELALICTRALMYDRDERYSTAAEMRADLEAYLKRQGASATAEALGEHITLLFAADQARMQKLVEQQLAALRATDFADEAATGSGHRVSTAGDPPSSGREQTTGHQPMVKSASSPPTATRISSPSSSRMWAVAIGLSVVAAGAFVMRHRLLGELRAWPAAQARATAPADVASPPAPSATAAGAAVVIAPAPTQPAQALPAAGYIRVRIAVTPPGARITLDGINVGMNPFEGKLMRDGAMHRLLVDAPGFGAQGRMITFDGDVDLSIPLVPRDKAQSPTATATAAAAPMPDLPPLKPR